MHNNNLTLTKQTKSSEKLTKLENLVKYTCICIAHRREAPLMRYRFPYVSTNLRKLVHQRTLRDHGYGLVYHEYACLLPSFRLVLIPA